VLNLSLAAFNDAGVDQGALWLAAMYLLVGTLGSATASALLVYSPSKLCRRLKNNDRTLVDDLQAHDFEYQIIARSLGLLGVAGTAVCVAGATTFLPWWFLWAGAALLLYGVLPAALAERRPEAILIHSQPLLRLLRIALHYPIVVPFRAFTHTLLRMLRMSETPATDRDEIAEDILAAVDDSAAENSLQDSERQWLGNIVELKDISVGEAMTPRTDIVSIEDCTPLHEAVAIALRSGHSRYPVYRERIDDVVGVFYAKDALRVGQPPEEGQPAIDANTPVREMMRKPLFVPHNMGVVELLEQFKCGKVQLAVVSDEYGGTAGLISIEDILEEIVGDINDEYDADDDDTPTVIEEGRILELSARERVEEVNVRLGTDLPEEGDYDTIAGFVFSELGRIPKVGETFSCHGVEFEILSADERRLDRLRVVALAPHHDSLES